MGRIISIDSKSVFNTLYSSRRIQILFILYRRELCAHDVARELNQLLSTVLGNIKSLENDGMIERVGIKRYQSQKPSSTYTSRIKALDIRLGDDGDLVITSIK